MTARGKQKSVRSVTDVDAVVGNRIRALRLEQRLSQAAVADHLGVSFQQIQKYERGVNRLSIARAQQIAGLMKVEIGNLLGKANGLDMVSALDTESYKLALSFRRLPPHLKVRVRALINAIVEVK